MIKMYAETTSPVDLTKTPTSEATKKTILGLGKKAGKRGAGRGTINPALRGSGNL